MIAREYQRSFRNLLDLVQEGNIGLMEAVKNFDPYRGVRFPSYAVWWIRAYIIRYIMNNWRMVKLGTTQAQRKLFFNLQKEKDRLEREGFVAGPKLIAERLDVKETEVIEMEQRLGASDLSVDTPLGDGEDVDAARRPAERRRDRRGRGRRRRVPPRGRRAASASSATTLKDKERGDLRPAPAGRGAAHAAGDRRTLRHQPRARAADRGAAQAGGCGSLSPA